MMRSFSEWLVYINALHPREMDFDLDKIAQLAQSLALTKFTCPVITIAGTNGKGSVVKFLESIYLAAGFRTAAYTSPHLLRFNERLRINGEVVADDILISAFVYIEQHRGELALTFFEFTTLAILYICQHTPLDILILEVGLGGRLDAVNIVDADIAVITSIDLDHTDYLGPDRETIAREKIGIARAGKPVVCGDNQPPQSLLERMKQLNAPFYCLDKNFHLEKNPDTWEWYGPHSHYLQLPLPTLKLENAAISLMLIELLQTRLPVMPSAVVQGMKMAKLAGRYEFYSEAVVPIIFDVAHNPQATRYLACQLQQNAIRGKTLAVAAMLSDKDIEASLSPLLSQVDAWYFADLDQASARGAKGERLMNYLTTKKQKNCYNFASVKTALCGAIEASGSEDRIVVFGSFYTVALAKQFLLGEKNGS